MGKELGNLIICEICRSGGFEKLFKFMLLVEKIPATAKNTTSTKAKISQEIKRNNSNVQNLTGLKTYEAFRFKKNLSEINLRDFFISTNSSS